MPLWVQLHTYPGTSSSFARTVPGPAAEHCCSHPPPRVRSGLRDEVAGTTIFTAACGFLLFSVVVTRSIVIATHSSHPVSYVTAARNLLVRFLLAALLLLLLLSFTLPMQ